MIVKVLQAIRCMKKAKFHIEDRIIIELIKEAVEEFVKMLEVLFSKCLEK